MHENGQAGKPLHVPSQAMAQLIAGFRADQAVQVCEGTENEKRLLEVLFPSCDPYWYVDDL